MANILVFDLGDFPGTFCHHLLSGQVQTVAKVDPEISCGTAALNQFEVKFYRSGHDRQVTMLKNQKISCNEFVGRIMGDR